MLLVLLGEKHKVVCPTEMYLLLLWHVKACKQQPNMALTSTKDVLQPCIYETFVYWCIRMEAYCYDNYGFVVYFALFSLKKKKVAFLRSHLVLNVLHSHISRSF